MVKHSDCMGPKNTDALKKIQEFSSAKFQQEFNTMMCKYTSKNVLPFRQTGERK
jgi:hypothetical protein